MAFLKKRNNNITEEERKKLLNEINSQLTGEELRLLVKALKKPTLKSLALSKLREYV